MTIHYKTQAIVFKKKDINESDRFFSVFTDDFGRLDIFAKAIRKIVSKLRSSIDIFFVSDIEFIQGKNRKTLIDSIVLNKFNNISENPEKFKVALKIGELLDNFINGEEKDDKVFNLIKEVFSILDDKNLKSEKYSLLYYYFLWNLLSLLGYHPEIQKCNVCKEKLNPYNIYFSYKSGGILCKKCLSHDTLARKINSDMVKVLKLIFNKEWAIISKLKIEIQSQKMFNEASDRYYSYILSSDIIKQ